MLLGKGGSRANRGAQKKGKSEDNSGLMEVEDVGGYRRLHQGITVKECLHLLLKTSA